MKSTPAAAKRWLSVVIMAMVALALSWWTGPVEAVAEMVHETGTTTQYVIVIDDSGSMRVRTQDGPAADPDRLAVFATQALLQLLDDRDEVTVVRLNGPADGESVTPVAPLRDNRSRLDEMLALDGLMAQYPGQRTPCKRALEAIQEELNQAYRPGVRQVMLFLTDGECNDGTLQPTSYLQGVNSHRDEQFQFYLLRWRGRVYSEYLVELADQTGGSVSLVSADDPTELLRPFATVMSQSQGHDAYLLTPDEPVLPAHRGARRMRLLAVTPDRGQDLGVDLFPDGDGEAPEQVGSTITGLHQYEDGGRYRYAFLEYRPGTAPVRVDVDGAADEWQVVALPDYRLFVETSIFPGRCGTSNEETSHSEVGGDICMEMSLVNEQGETVTADVAGRTIEGLVSYRAPEEDEADELAANQVGDDPVFRFERVNLEQGDHVFVPNIVLHGEEGAGVAIRGAMRSLQVSSRRVEADPGRLDLGDLLPGTEHYHEVSIDGNFPTTRGRLTVEGRDRIPECLTFKLNGEPEGEGQSITAGQTYTVEAHVAPYCGPASNEFPIDTALRLQFDQSGSSGVIPSMVLPIRGSLIHEFRSPPQLKASLTGGESRDVELELEGNHQRSLELTALVPAEDERRDWPGRNLSIQLLDDDNEPVEPAGDGSSSASVTVPVRDDDEADSPVLSVRIEADACCQDGEYRTEMALVAPGATGTPVRVPIDVEVESAGFWQCWGPWMVRAFLLVLLLLLVAYVVNMWRSSRFLDPDRLASRLVPLEWDDFGEARPRNDAARDVRRMVRDNMSWFDRAKAWIKANPLIFGLPGREYYEMVELLLEDSPNVRRSRVRLVEELDFISELRANPRRGEARLYATARGGTSFYVVCAEENRVGKFEMKDEFAGFDDGFGDEPFEPELEQVRRRSKFVTIYGGQEPDTMAGWRVG